MDDAGKIGAGIVAAAVVLAVAFIGYREFDRQRNIAEVNAMFRGFSELPAQMEAQAVETSRRQRAAQAQRQAYDLQRRALSTGQRCVAGVVIQVSGASYTQLGTVGDPVRCSGNLADRPLR